MERHERGFVRIRKITGEQLNRTHTKKATHKNNKFAVQIYLRILEEVGQLRLSLEQ